MPKYTYEGSRSYLLQWIYLSVLGNERHKKRAKHSPLEHHLLSRDTTFYAGWSSRPYTEERDYRLIILHHDPALLDCLMRLASGLAFPTSGYRGRQTVVLVRERKPTCLNAFSSRVWKVLLDLTQEKDFYQ
jgi:hypothetical protein